MSAYNIVLALTNLAALPALYMCAERGLWTHFALVLQAAVASAVYHLAECEKHDLPAAWPWLRPHARLAQWINRFAAIAAIALFVLPFIPSLDYAVDAIVALWHFLYPLPLCAGLALAASEYLPLTPEGYVALHGWWHVTAFAMAARLVSLIV